MFLLSLISYIVLENDPPVIFAYIKDQEITKSLYETFEDKKNAFIIRPSRSNVTIRISKLDTFKDTCKIGLDKVYVYQNSTELQQIYDKNGTTGYTVQEQIIDGFDADACNYITDKDSNVLVIVTDHYPEFPKVGYSNPFTPGVWNCFFFILFTLSFIIWSMIHYANIDVQTRFAKKLY